MRIANNMIYAGIVFNAQKNLQKVDRAQEDISLGTMVNRPSDDPTGFSNILGIHGHLDRNNQYDRNITDGLSWMNQAESSFDDATLALQTVREKTVQASNGTLTEEETKAVGKEVDAMLDQMVKVGNSDLGGKYIFAGLNNAAPPFKRNGDTVTFSGDYTALKREIAPGAQFRINADTQAIFNEQVNSVVSNPASPFNSLDASNLQFGSYYIDTAVATAATGSAATVEQAYTQAENTIVSSASVPVANNYNASILMSVTDITYDTNGKITSVTATFSSHEYDSAGNVDNPATCAQTFTATNGDPDAATFNIGNINNFSIDLTNAVMKGDQAVINVKAAAAVGDKQITVRSESGNCLQWSFNPAAVDNKGSKLNFYTVDTDNGENYDGSISFKAGVIDNLNEAVSFTFGNTFDMLVYLRKKLDAANFGEASNMLKYIDQKSEMILQTRSEFGARVNHFEAVRKQYGNQETILSDVLTKFEDSDLAKININYEESLAAYQNVLSSAAKIMKTSLLDYLG